MSSLVIETSGLSKTYRIWRDPVSRFSALCYGGLLRKWPARLLPPVRARLAARLAACSREFHALRDVSFKVSAGESIGIIGLNGSGKSTLLQILAGTLSPSEGRSRVEGRVAALLELGSGFNPEFTGRENVFLNAAILGVPAAEMQRRFADVVAFAEIGDFIEQPVKTYSSGMTMRLAFAVLTQVDPDILIIDEALSVGDAYFQHKCGHCIRRFRDLGKTILFVSHDPGSIKALCDRAILLDKGLLVREGQAEVVLDYYNAIIATKEKDAEIRQIETEGGRVLTRSGNRKAEITRFELSEPGGSPVRSVVTGATVRFRASVLFREAVEKPTFGILIRDRLGRDVYGTNTFHSRVDPVRFEAGDTMEVEADLDLILGPGSYSFTLAAHADADHTGDNFDWIDHAIVVQIMPARGRHFIGCVDLPCRLGTLRVPGTGASPSPP